MLKVDHSLRIPTFVSNSSLTNSNLNLKGVQCSIGKQFTILKLIISLTYYSSLYNSSLTNSNLDVESGLSSNGNQLFRTPGSAILVDFMQPRVQFVVLSNLSEGLGNHL